MAFAPISAKASLDATEFTAGVLEIKKRLNELNTAYESNKAEMKQFGTEMNKLEREKRKLTEQMKDGGTNEQKQDAKYLLHSFTQIEYIAGNRIGYAGAGNQIMVQGYLAYSQSIFAENAQAYGNLYYYKYAWLKPYSTYLELSLDFYKLPSSNRLGQHYNKVFVELSETHEKYMRYKWRVVAENDTVIDFTGNQYNNYNAWSGMGIGIRWDSIMPPNTKIDGQTFECGYITGRLYILYRNIDIDRVTNLETSNIYTADSGNNSDAVLIPFSSLDEYNAAVGLTYEPLTLTEVVDNPTVVSGKNGGEEVT